MRTIVFAFGLVLIVRGLLFALNPQLWRSMSRRYVGNNPSEPLGQMVGEYASLSDRSLSYLSLWSALTGLLMVALSARARD